MSKFSQLILILFLFSGCISSDREIARKQIYYFDIESYFNSEAEQLANKKVIKTVSKNDVSETKEMLIGDWKQELALFTESDINKAAFKDSYEKDSTNHRIKYTAKDEELKVRTIEIDFEDGVVKKISINNSTNNLLYHGTEELIFIPDSMYQINKHQKVILLGLNNYEIKGLFK